MKKYLSIVLWVGACFGQIETGEVIWEENFDNLENWIIENGNGSWGWETESYNIINLKMLKL